MRNTEALDQQEETIIQHRITVPLALQAAFTAFAEELGNWWPAAYTWAQDVLETIAIEPQENGRCFERGLHNFECDWGRVLQWQPPHQLAFTWQISPRREPAPNPENASEIHLRFEPEADGSGTQILFEHRHLDSHGEGWQDYHTALASAPGWSYILDCYVNYVS